MSSENYAFDKIMIEIFFPSNEWKLYLTKIYRQTFLPAKRALSNTVKARKTKEKTLENHITFSMDLELYLLEMDLRQQQLLFGTNDHSSGANHLCSSTQYCLAYRSLVD